MKATINEDGELSITPEDPLESYALRKWHIGYKRYDVEGDSDSVLRINLIHREGKDDSQETKE